MQAIPRLATLSLALLLAGCTLPFGESSAPVPADVSPADATKMVDHFWQTREDGYVKLSCSCLDAVESGDLLAIDTAALQFRTQFKLPGELSPRQLANVKIYAPHQTDYPGQFLATGDAPEVDADLKPGPKPLTHVILFTRQDPAADYKASLMSIQDPAQTLPELAVDGDGFAKVVPAAGQAADYKVSSDIVGQKYADTMAALKQGQPAPANLFAAGGFTTEEGAKEKNVIALELQKSVQLQINWSSLTTRTNFAYQTKDGSAFALFEARANILVVNTGGNGGGFCIIFLPTKAAAASGIHPGVFRALAFNEIIMAGAVIPKASEKDKLVFIPAMASGPSDVTAAPCS